MRRKERTRILAEGNPALLDRLAEQVEKAYPIEVVREPERSLVMCRAVDSVANQPFYLGELLITECTVSIRETEGFGAIAGENADFAYKLAVVDAACRARLPETEGWDKLLKDEEERIRQKTAEEHARIEQTKVQFDVKR